MLLSDFAEVVNGKLYIQGAGFTLVAAARPVNIAVSVLVHVDWNETNTHHNLKIELVDSDNHPVMQGDMGVVHMEGQFETGRPQGSRPGTEFAVPIAVTFGGVNLPPGRYAVQVALNGETASPVLLREPFDAIGALPT